MEDGEIPQKLILQKHKTSLGVVSLTTENEREDASVLFRSSNLHQLCKLKRHQTEKETFTRLLAGKIHEYHEGKISFDNCCLFKKLSKLN